MIDKILASTVIATIIAQLVTIVLTLSNNNRIRAIEKQKIQRESDSFRYKLLFDMLKEIKHEGVAFNEVDFVNDTDDPVEFVRKHEENFDNRCNSVFKSYSSIHVRSREQIRILKALLDEEFLDEILELNKQGEDCLRSSIYLFDEIEKKREEVLKEEIITPEQISNFFQYKRSEMLNRNRIFMRVVGDCSRKIEETIQKQLRLLNSMR